MAAILLDRDGVINENRAGHVTCWEEFRFLPRSLEALAALERLGLRLAVVTNQSAVGRGLLAPQALEEIHRRMIAGCASRGAAIEAVFVCPHAPWDSCGCRKPQPGLLLQAMHALGERPERCVAIGDGHEDWGAAEAAGVPFVLVRTGRGEETLRHLDYRQCPTPLIARELWEAYQALRAHFDGRMQVKAA